jgi:mevalonate kinase
MAAGPLALPVSARAPGKCIVFGEHSVVHGGPELLFAIDLYTQVVLTSGAVSSLNADRSAADENPYFRTLLAELIPRGQPVAVRSVSRIPRAAGLGSSAAFVAAFARAVGGASVPGGPGALAQRCFEIERSSQGVGSPGDTSASVAGGYLTVNASAGEPLWTVRGEERQWEVRRLDDPGWVWIVAYSGIPRSTADAVKAVGRRLERPDGPALLRSFAECAEAGIAAVRRSDRDAVAAELARNQELLREVGVSHPRLEALLDAVRPVAQGAKLTGAGCGGSIVVLPQPGRETDAMRRLARAGAVPYAVRPSAAGAELIPAA